MRQKAFRPFCDDLDGVLEHYRGVVRVVVIWRQDDSRKARWTYLCRLRVKDYEPSLSFTDLVHCRFGGGWYKAKLYGDWIRGLRREEYLEQVSFGICGPPTPETQHLVHAASEKRAESRPQQPDDHWVGV